MTTDMPGPDSAHPSLGETATPLSGTIMMHDIHRSDADNSLDAALAPIYSTQQYYTIDWFGARQAQAARRHT